MLSTRKFVTPRRLSAFAWVLALLACGAFASNPSVDPDAVDWTAIRKQMPEAITGSTLWPSTPASNEFGHAIAADGDTVLIGAPQHAMWYPQAGVVYVFTRNNGAWTRQMVLYANDGQQGDYFGCSVALTGNTAVVGACGDDVGGNVDQGSAYVFTRSGTTWTFRQKLTASNGAASDEFGSAVAVDYYDGYYTAVIGAPYTDRPSSGLYAVGNAYVFKRNIFVSSTWSQQSILGWDGIGLIGSRDWFGYSVAIEGNRILIGAPGGTAANAPHSGLVARFSRSSTAQPFSYDRYITNNQINSLFGFAVAMQGGRYVIGVPTSIGGGQVYLCSEDIFCRVRLRPNPENYDYFGASVALDGDTVIVGALGSSDTALFGGWAGAYSWSSGAFLGAISDGPIADYAHRGYAVAMQDGYAFVGIPGEDAVVVVGGYNDLHADGFE